MFNGSCYSFRKDMKDWESAREYCKSLGSELVKITSNAENEFIRNQTVIDYWIGLNDKDIEGRFKWSVDNSSIQDNGNYSRWASGQPDNDDGIQDCGVIYSTGTWDDRNCIYGHYFTCEKPAS
ncbi:hepatic lectin-like [Macrobrachium nipponense]|uniref:hepatic lectin-like n=1 Tax=Macrobrachium nipponense TaxID=159736 RepID=UPI0030C7AECD